MEGRPPYWAAPAVRTVLVTAITLLFRIGTTLAQVPPTTALPPTTEAPEPSPAAPDRWLLMDLLKDTPVGRGLEGAGTQIYGWIQQGFAGNLDNPRDRVNFGANYDWRANDYRLK